MSIPKRIRWNPLACCVLALAGCAGGASPQVRSVDPQILDEVYELRAGEEGGGADSGGASPVSAGNGLPVGFSGTQELSGRFGGEESAHALSSGCVGHISAQPNHVLYNSGELPFLQLVVNANPHDTTLVVELPDGSFACNDDTHGLNPAVQLAPAQAGQLRIWVGSYSANTEGPYRLAVTTERSVTAETLGAPAGE